MRASSDTIAQLAAAMAKAQSELINPAKSLTAVLERGRNGSGAQSYRYAPLSSGLDIVRKTFGKYELAVIQTTHVDRERLLVHLTTTIAHSSGEWISALYPVCHLSDIGHPKLMGALLTYARRYCLFTMVGLAGEDDLDAPDLLTANAREVAGNGPDPETTVGGKPDINLERSSAHRSRKKARAMTRRLRLHRMWSLPAAGGGLPEELGPPLPHLRDQGIQAAIWPTLRMRTRCFAGR